VLLAPPFVATESELERVVERLGRAVDEALREVKEGAA
jgi:adenosylmethionine-8-amino-7-oxononanoate aminotransferase